MYLWVKILLILKITGENMALFDNYKPEDVVYITSKKISQELRNAEPEIKRPIKFTKIKGVKKAATELQNYVEHDPELVVGGSTATWMQVKKFRVPKDLDLSAEHLEREVNNIAMILRQKYGTNNVVITPKVRVNMGGKEVDVVQIGIGTPQSYVDAVDVKHEVDEGFITVHRHPSIRIGNFNVEPLGYLIHRKAVSIKQNYVDEIKKGKLPKPRMRKDIDDFMVTSKSVPDFQRKNLQVYMDAFEKNLLKDIPSEPATKAVKVPQPQINLFGLGGLGSNGDPFGISGFIEPKSTSTATKKKVNPLNVSGFQLW